MFCLLNKVSDSLVKILDIICAPEDVEVPLVLVVVLIVAVKTAATSQNEQPYANLSLLISYPK